MNAALGGSRQRPELLNFAIAITTTSRAGRTAIFVIERITSMSTVLIERIRAFSLFAQRGELAIPGSEPKGLTVTATSESLIVRAIASHSHSRADGEIRFCEFSEGGLCRQFDLPSTIEVNTVSASLDKGVLKGVAVKAANSSARYIRREWPGAA
jgi:hypothetical protein